MKKIYWRPAKLIEDPLTRETYVLMYGGSGLVRYVRTTDIEEPVYSEDRRAEKELDRKNSRHK